MTSPSANSVDTDARAYRAGQRAGRALVRFVLFLRFGPKVAKALKAKALESYDRLLESSLADGMISPEERAELARQHEALGITPDRAERFQRERTLAIVDARVLKCLADGELSPEEEMELADLAEKLGVAPSFSDEIRGAMDRARTNWRRLHGPLPSVQSSFGLQRGEACYYEVEARALEPRTRTRSTSYYGPVVSIPLVGGIHFRAGHLASVRQQEDFNFDFGSGRCALTDRRLIFASQKRTITIRFTQIIDVEPFTDGAKVFKSSGKPLYLLTPNGDGFSMLLVRAWTAARA